MEKIKQRITINFKLNLNTIWTIINSDNQEFITNILNNNWLFVKKQDNKNILTLDMYFDFVHKCITMNPYDHEYRR